MRKKNKIKLQKDHGTNRNATSDKPTSPQQQNCIHIDSLKKKKKASIHINMDTTSF